MDKVILHCDLNCFYASVEMLFHPHYRQVPFAVGGDVERRHGIILAKNALAKKAGVKTGEALWQAKQKCPDLQCVTPNFSLYLEFSKKVSAIYRDYTDQIEPFGIDESWLDVTQSLRRYQSPTALAHEIMQRILNEVGLTVSIGISDNKIYAKLGSDLAGTMEIVEIQRDNLAATIYPLEVSNLLYVGRQTTKKLNKYHVYTIGDLASVSLNFLELRFKKWGQLLYQLAHGIDQDHVLLADAALTQVKSIGNGVTASRDLTSWDDYKMIVYRLAESVCERQAQQQLCAYGIAVMVRDFELLVQSKQKKCDFPLLNSKDVAHQALLLIDSLIQPNRPVRSLSIKLFELQSQPKAIQMDLFAQENNLADYQLDQAISTIRRRFGPKSISRAIMLLDPQLTDFYPKNEHVIHPISYLKKGINEV